jgi:hypothetical protein
MMPDEICELCGNKATHLCECETCLEYEESGRWLCVDCGLFNEDEE